MPRWDVHFEMRVNTQDPEVVRLLFKVDAMASVIRGIPIPPYVQNRLDNLNIMRAVRGTIAIEGTEVSEEEVEEILRTPADQQVLPRNRAGDEQEVRSVVASGFAMPMGERIDLAGGLVDVAHAARLVLVDRDGGVRGYYGSDAVGLDEVFHRTRQILAE